MCGRFVQFSPPVQIAKTFGVEQSRILLPDMVKARYNLAPSQPAIIVRLSGADSQRRLSYATWGLLPHWAKESKFPYSTINARAETVESKPAFRDSFRSRRALVPCDGWYEWKLEGKVKQPYLFHMQDKQPFALAGLWDTWEGLVEGMQRKIESFTIVVTEANEDAKQVHNRMPVILPAETWATWLNLDTSVAQLKSLLVPYVEESLEVRQVSRAVNSTSNDSAGLLG